MSQQEKLLCLISKNMQETLAHFFCSQDGYLLSKDSLLSGTKDSLEELSSDSCDSLKEAAKCWTCTACGFLVKSRWSWRGMGSC